MATRSRHHYHVDILIMDQGGLGYPRPSADGPYIDRPACKLGSTMDVGSSTFHGIRTKDIKQVEWFVAQHRAWGVAVYYSFDEDYDESGNWVGAGDQDKHPAVYHSDDGVGRYIGRLYDPADMDLAQAELIERDRRTAENLDQIKAATALREDLRSLGIKPVYRDEHFDWAANAARIAELDTFKRVWGHTTMPRKEST